MPPRIPKPFRFECTACGLCCRWGGFVCLYPEDARRLADHLGLTLQQFVDEHAHHISIEYTDEEGVLIIPYLTLKSNGDACEFLEGNLCGVHSAKPIHCAESPFLAEFLLDETGLNEFETNCEGMGQGPLHDISSLQEALNRQSLRDQKYEADLEAKGWDLSQLLGVTLPEPELVPDIGLELEY